MIKTFPGLAILIFISFDLIGQNRVCEKELTIDKSTLIKVYHLNGELFNGVVYTTFDSVINDSSIIIKEEYNVVNGQKNGLYKRVYESGNLEIKANYKNGKKDGVWKKWFENGTLKYDGIYKNGQKDGIIKSWYSNGNLSFLNSYKNGKRHGLCINYSKTGNGMILCDKNYVNGKMAKQKCYNYE